MQEVWEGADMLEVHQETLADVGRKEASDVVGEPDLPLRLMVLREKEHVLENHDTPYRLLTVSKLDSPDLGLSAGLPPPCSASGASTFAPACVP